ncbi:MAG: IS5 family transposase [Candidatus Sulfotelmatobacter sp.]
MKRRARFQQTLASQSSFERHARKSKRELFLDQMERVVPWAELLALVEPHYPKAGNGRQPVGLEIMLRTYFLQQWFNLSDPGMEEAFYESPVLRRFAGVDLGRAAAPDETTILRFRHLLEAHDLCGQMLDAVNLYLASKGIRISTGTIVDATILHAPSSTKNSRGERDPEMHQTKKGNQWYFGAKAHIGVDSKATVVHSVATSAASVADKHMLPDLLHGDERKVWGDGGYQGQTEAIHAAAPKAQDMTCRRTKYKDHVDEEARSKNTTKARVRAKVEHPFRILKRVFGFTKVRYRGLWKNHQWICAAFALVNLYLHRNRLAPQGA